LRLGDPFVGISASVPAYKNDGTDGDFENRAGDHHDGMEWFGLSADGKRNDNATERGLLAMNHEATTDESCPRSSCTPTAAPPRCPAPPQKWTRKPPSTAFGGRSGQDGGKWAYVPGSAKNFRLTPLTPIEMSGPAAACADGHQVLAHRHATRGTLNNCGTGKTPWGTFLTGEENWFGYFFRSADRRRRTRQRQERDVAQALRPQPGRRSRHGWETGGSRRQVPALEQQQDRHSQRTAATTIATNERHGLHRRDRRLRQDPAAKKRTALGRFAHESAAFGKAVAGQPLAVYMGDDARNEYIYKFVPPPTGAQPMPTPPTAWPWATSTWTAASCMSPSSTPTARAMDRAVHHQCRHCRLRNYKFADQADVCVNTRLAADAVGATKMDRPEWNAVNPANGEIYFTLTNNSNRSVNPRAASTCPTRQPARLHRHEGQQRPNGNPNGHILRAHEGRPAPATTFTWDVYLFGAESDADAWSTCLPDRRPGLLQPRRPGVQPKSTGICWIQTDDGAYTDVTNCMMLAAMPGQVGDGGKKTLSYTKADGSSWTVDHFRGQGGHGRHAQALPGGPQGLRNHRPV
jgi:secreted PhoX family phosphatase